MKISKHIEIENEIDEGSVTIYVSNIMGIGSAADIDEKDAIKIIHHLVKVFDFKLLELRFASGTCAGRPVLR